jgi:tripartite-type tricarboxylate transporter receptor subunit TctC
LSSGTKSRGLCTAEFGCGPAKLEYGSARARLGRESHAIDKLNREIGAALADPHLKARIADFGGTPGAQSPAEFGKLIADETEKWSKVIRAANIKQG